MLTEKGYKALEDATGIKELQEIIEDEKAREIELKKTKHFSEIDYSILYENLTKQGLTKEKYEEAKKAGEEMAVRELKKEFDLKFEGRSVGALYEYLYKLVEQKSETDATKIREQYEADIEKLRQTLADKDELILRTERAREKDKIQGFLDSKFNALDFEAPKVLKDEEVANYINQSRAKEKIYFQSQYDWSIENGKIIAKKKGTDQVLKDELQNPVSADVLADKYISSVMSLKDDRKGRGESDRAPSHQLSSISSEDELMAYAKKKNALPGTEEFDAIYAEYKKNK